MRARLLAVVAVGLAAAVAGAYQNEESGFRGHEWGMALPKAWGLPVRTDPSFGGIRLYEDPAGAGTMGCAALEGVEYGFWQGRLSDVRVTFRGYDNYKCVLDAMKKQFGDGTQPNKSAERYAWVGGVTAILLNYDRQQKVGYLTFISRGIGNEQREWERAQGKKPAGSP